MGYLQEKKKALMNSAKGSRLPSEYQEVEWIGSDGSGQYIIVEQRTATYPYFPFSLDDTFKIKISSLANTDRMSACAVASYAELLINNLVMSARFYVSGNPSSVVLIEDEPCEYDFYVSKVFNLRYSPFLLFAYNINGNYSFKGKIYYFRWNRGADVYKELVPCYRKSDNEIGMYDIINDIFYTNQGTGTFTKGDDV